MTATLTVDQMPKVAASSWGAHRPRRGKSHRTLKKGTGLRRRRSPISNTRDRSVDLYDFAPIGYVSLDVTASIVDITLAGAALLGRARSFLLHATST